MLTALVELELTWMLLLGPPTIVMFGFPCVLRACDTVGFKTRIGIGDVASITPQIAVAPTFCLLVPFSIPAKKVGILSVIVTDRKAFAATVVGGAVTPGGAVPLTWKLTLFPRVPEVALLLEIAL